MQHFIRASFLTVILILVIGIFTIALGVVEELPRAEWKSGKIRLVGVTPLAMIHHAGKLKSLQSLISKDLKRQKVLDEKSDAVVFLAPLFEDGELRFVRVALGALVDPLSEAAFSINEKKIVSQIARFIGTSIRRPVKIARGKFDYIAKKVFWKPRLGSIYKSDFASDLKFTEFRGMLIVDGDTKPCGQHDHCTLYPVDEPELGNINSFMQSINLIARACCNVGGDNLRLFESEGEQRHLSVAKLYSIETNQKKGFR